NFDCELRPSYFGQGCPRREAGEADKVAFEVGEAIDGAQARAFVDPQEYLCSETCIMQANGVPTYTDESHLSVEGARLVVPEIERQLLKLTGNFAADHTAFNRQMVASQ